MSVIVGSTGRFGVVKELGSGNVIVKLSASVGGRQNVIVTSCEFYDHVDGRALGSCQHRQSSW